MIKVLHIINGADLGGISTFLLTYYSRMDREQFHFDFIYSLEQPLGYNGERLQELGAEFFYVPVKSKHPFIHIREVSRIIKEGGYEAVHVHSGYTSWLVLLIAKMNGVTKRFAHAHNAIKGKLEKIEAIKRWTGIRLIKKYATVRIACSTDAAEFTFRELPSETNNVVMIPNSIVMEKFLFNEEAREETRKELGISETSFVIGTVGRMTEEKNQIKLVEVFAELRKKISNVCLVLVGDGDQKERIGNAVKDYGLTNQTIFTGKRSDVFRLLNAFDAFCLPSFYEGFPISALEALANGLPLILSNTITRELEIFKNVSYVSLEDMDEKWADKIIELFKCQNRTDEFNRTILLNQYNIESSVKKLENLYKGK